MTVTYTAKVATVKFYTFWRLLKRWRGSVYKHVWKDGLLFITLYFVISAIYRLALTQQQKVVFEKVVLYCRKEADNIPVAFVLGFYVTIIVNRWWSQINDAMPWPDDLAISITSFVHGNDDRGRLMRRTLVRYVNLAWILSLCSISTNAKRRFPTLDHIVEIGMMTKNELEMFENVRTNANKYYIPLVWATTLISRARKEDRICSDHGKVYLIELILQFRRNLGTLFNYDWLSVPLVYTQVVTIAVQAYFLANVIGGQFLEENPNQPDRDIDMYIPVFHLLEFLFYMGWLKVAESLINPFGEDDDDFDTNWVFDRNIQASYIIVDEMHSENPDLIRDAYWDSLDFVMPYTAAAEQYKTGPYLGSAANMEFNQEESTFVPMKTIKEDETGSKDSGKGGETRLSIHHLLWRAIASRVPELLKRKTSKDKGTGSTASKQSIEVAGAMETSTPGISTLEQFNITMNTPPSQYNSPSYNLSPIGNLTQARRSEASTLPPNSTTQPNTIHLPPTSSLSPTQKSQISIHPPSSTAQHNPSNLLQPSTQLNTNTNNNEQTDQYPTCIFTGTRSVAYGHIAGTVVTPTRTTRINNINTSQRNIACQEKCSDSPAPQQESSRTLPMSNIEKQVPESILLMHHEEENRMQSPEDASQKMTSDREIERRSIDLEIQLAEAEKILVEINEAEDKMLHASYVSRGVYD